MPDTFLQSHAKARQAAETVIVLKLGKGYKQSWPIVSPEDAGLSKNAWRLLARGIVSEFNALRAPAAPIRVAEAETDKCFKLDFIDFVTVMAAKDGGVI